MKKLLTIAMAALCIIVAACSHSVSKKDVMKKMEEGKELTTEDYSVLVSSLEEEYNQFLKILDKNPLEYTDQDTALVQEIFTTSLIVSQGKMDGKLTADDVKKLDEMETRMQAELEKQKAKMSQGAIDEAEKIEETIEPDSVKTEVIQ